MKRISYTKSVYSYLSSIFLIGTILVVSGNLAATYAQTAVATPSPGQTSTTPVIDSRARVVVTDPPAPSTTATPVPRFTPRPYQQEIVIRPEYDLYAPDSAPNAPSGTGNSKSLAEGNKVKKTSMITPRRDAASGNMLYIPGASGVLVETLEGKPLIDSYSTSTFNPASNVKIATSYAVLKTFGPNYRISLTVLTDGVLDKSTGTLNGNLYVSGRDPSFSFENAVTIAESLNKIGIVKVTGNLVVNNGFIMSLSNSVKAGKIFMSTMNASSRTSGATKAWTNHSLMKGKAITSTPHVEFSGSLSNGVAPSNAKLLFSHESAPLKEIVKLMMCYSNNFLAERLGEMVGGPSSVARLVQVNTGTTPSEFTIQTSSGLGVNRATPRAMMKLLRVLRTDLAKNKLNYADIMPIAGVDVGTLQRRFTEYGSAGSVVGKTGTLGSDGGVSALAGEAQTKQGKILFVIFNQQGSPASFRNFQNSFVSSLQQTYGGAQSLGYSSASIASRMANTRVMYPTGK